MKKKLTFRMVLAAIYERNGEATAADLALQFSVTSSRVSGAVYELKRKELVSVASKGRYVITNAGRAFVNGEELVRTKQPKTRPITMRAAAWWHLRARRRATIAEIMRAHSETGKSSSRASLWKYLQALARAGILNKSRRLHQGETVWSLSVDVGPKVPLFRPGCGEVFDPNSEKTIFVSYSDRQFNEWKRKGV